MSSPTDTNSMCYNDNSPPLYPSTNRFHPLGFSTPQERGQSSHQARNYYSVQPKHMLPRARGFHGRNRYGHNDAQDQDRTRFSQEDMQPGDNFARSWRGHHNRNQRFGGHRQHHNRRPNHHMGAGTYNIRDYFHPSMLEDPWQILQQKNVHSDCPNVARRNTEDIGAESNIIDDRDL